MRDFDLLLGAHLSIAGGYERAADEAGRLGCTALQIFTKSANQWRERRVTPEEGALFRERLAAAGVRVAVSHAGYLLNLASPDDALSRRSIDALVAEIERCSVLGLPGVVLHPGSPGESEVAGAIARVADALAEAIDRTPGAGVRVLLENTAGQGHVLGADFGELAGIISRAGRPERLGVCFDTAHAFAAGHDLRTPEMFGATIARLDGAVGLANVRLIHVNDSRRELGSRVDRHEGLGHGTLGMEAFRLLLGEPRLDHAPKILETPKEDDEGQPMDPVNLAVMRELWAEVR